MSDDLFIFKLFNGILSMNKMFFIDNNIFKLKGSLKSNINVFLSLWFSMF